jgi:predicted nucleotidyltransferase
LKDLGLTTRDRSTIDRIFRGYPGIREVRIFGSRAKGLSHPGSDLDFAIMNEGFCFDELLHIRSDFEESDLPYTVDIVYYPTLKHEALKNHINRVGTVVYRSMEAIGTD